MRRQADDALDAECKRSTELRERISKKAIEKTEWKERAEKAEAEAKALRETLLAEHNARKLMQEWLEQNHPSKSRYWIDYIEAVKRSARMDEMTRAALNAGKE